MTGKRSQRRSHGAYTSSREIISSLGPVCLSQSFTCRMQFDHIFFRLTLTPKLIRRSGKTFDRNRPYRLLTIKTFLFRSGNTSKKNIYNHKYVTIKLMLNIVELERQQSLQIPLFVIENVHQFNLRYVSATILYSTDLYLYTQPLAVHFNLAYNFVIGVLHKKDPTDGPNTQ